MKWFRRRRSHRRAGKPFDPAELGEAKRLSVDEATAEGMMLAEYASRMQLKNRIIVGALATAEPYDAKHYLVPAQGALQLLSTESRAAAARLDEQLRSAAQYQGKSGHAHDYKSADAGNLRHRRDVSTALADHLTDLQRDDDFLRGLIENARLDAWSDISRVVEEMLDRANIVVDAAYERERDKRMRLVSRDLTRLAATRG